MNPIIDSFSNNNQMDLYDLRDITELSNRTIDADSDNETEELAAAAAPDRKNARREAREKAPQKIHKKAKLSLFDQQTKAKMGSLADQNALKAAISLLAKKISDPSGHTCRKHKELQGGPNNLTEMVLETLQNPALSKNLKAPLSCAFFSEKFNLIVISNPKGEGSGTAYFGSQDRFQKL